MIVIGVDPGARTGFAVVDDGRLVAASTHRAEMAAVALSGHIMEYEVGFVAIEIPGAGIYARPGQNARAMCRIARNVGQCQERAEQLCRMAEQMGCEVVRVHPKRGGTKRAWPATVWRSHFCWVGRMPSNHARDAALLAERVWIERQAWWTAFATSSARSIRACCVRSQS